MQLEDKVVVVTGGASGLGLALCTRFAREGARVVLSDLSQSEAEARAAGIGATAVAADVGDEHDVANLVATTLDELGRLDVFVCNAGIVVEGSEHAPIDQWKRIYDVHVLAHVYAAKYALPHMLERGDGQLLNVASAAGLLTEFQSAPQTVAGHAAVGFAEWLALTYGPRGIKVSALCPAAVVTPILDAQPSLPEHAITTEQLTEIVIDALAHECFLICTDDVVRDLFRVKGDDYEHYLALMNEQREHWAAA
jgi:NAD(P)-dependent dehydrogenase (short-subunit alcohol dehydrogenase family)